MTRPTKQIVYAFWRILNEYEVGNSLSDSSVEAQAASDFMDFTAAKDAKDPVLGNTVGQRTQLRWSHRFKCFNLMTAAILLTIQFFHTPTSEFWNFFNLRCAPASGYVQIIYANLCTKLQLRARRGVVILQAPQVWVTSGQQIVLVLLDDAYLRRRNYHGEYSQDNWDVISRNFRYWICYLLFFLDDLETCRCHALHSERVT